MPESRPWRWLLVAVVACAVAAAAERGHADGRSVVAASDAPTAPAATDSAAAAAKPRRITIIGASVSDGFGVRLRTTRPDGTRPVIGVNLATLLEAAARDPGAITVTTHASSRFFLSPDVVAKGSVERTVKDRPSLVLAIDWLFWSSYGSKRADGERINGCEDRLERLERALAILQPLVETGVPIVLGDLPDMHDAIEGGMLTESMVPDADCLGQLNARITAWSKERPNVALLDLADVVRRTITRQPVRACNRDWCEADLGPLLQKDRLHPTLNGSLAVLAAALQAADTRTSGTTSTAFDLDPERVRERLGARASADASRPATDAGAGDRAAPKDSATNPSAAPSAPPAAAGSPSPSAP